MPLGALPAPPAAPSAAETESGGAVLWQPDEQRRRSTQLWRFAAEVGFGLDQHTYRDLHRWSVRRPEQFWRSVWSFCDGIGELGPEFLSRHPTGGVGQHDRGAGRHDRSADAPLGPGLAFFEGSSLNLAENYLRPAHLGGLADTDIALVCVDESAAQTVITRAELADAVAACQRALAADGVGIGDRVATMLRNGPEAVVVFLATVSLGAVFSSVSPDFGIDGVLDRFGQIAPTVLVATDGYFYNGAWHETASKALSVAAALTAAGTPLRRLVIAPLLGAGPAERTAAEHNQTDLPGPKRTGAVPSTAERAGANGPGAGFASAEFTEWATWLAPHRSASGADLAFEQLDFDQPVSILYSSGTTGKPKCIVHRAGGVLLKLWTEQRLHFDLGHGDRLLYFTTTGWMMWNWLVAGLTAGACLVLYDGSPFHPSPARLFDEADRWGVTLFGVSAKFIEGARKAGIQPAKTHSLATLRSVASTGSPLAPEAFDWVYQQVKSDVHLASFSGGTDICGGFVIGCPTAPVRRGEIQAPALGLDIDVADAQGDSLPAGARGELVCRNPFVSMPLRFWNDPDDERYRAAYFERYQGIWCHGDFATWTPSGGMIISGRSDATLNPGGVRIGTAEIYRQVDQVDEVLESVVIGQRVPGSDGSAPSGDTRIVLFVRLREGVRLDDDLKAAIRAQIRSGASPRHVPAVIAQVPTIPRTRSGKLVELAIKDVAEGRPVTNIDAIDDPQALRHFADHPALRAHP